MTIDVTGGSGGVGAALEDLSAAAVRLTDVAGMTAASALAVLRVAASPDLLVATSARPGEGARLAARLARVAGPQGLGGEAAALYALAAAVRAAVTAYAAGEAAVLGLVESAQDAALFALSRHAVPAGAGVAALHRAGVDVPSALDRLAFEAPGLVDLAGGVEGVLAGPVTPLRYEDALALLARGGSLRGWLTEGGRTVRALPLDPAGTAAAPSDVSDLVAAQRDLSAPGAGPGRVRVVEVPQADGSRRWVVVIPGTQSWEPVPGSNPSDLTSDVLLMAGEATLLARGVEQALAAAQARAGRAGRGDPVLLAGHSQGGIAAAALAADPGFRGRAHVTHVVTSGAPTARFPVPGSVSVLSLEHVQDPVPRLEGEPNADRRSHLTVTRDLGAEAGVRQRASAAHDSGAYESTAELADHSASASLADWRAGAAGFFAGGSHGVAVVRDFRVERLGPAP